MDHSRLEMLHDSMNALDKEIREAILAEDTSLVHYHLFRCYRLIEKVQLENKHSLLPFYHFISKWHQRLAQMYESKGYIEEAEREWLSSISFHVGDTDQNPYVQFAHSTLAVQNLSVSREIKEHMPYISMENIKSVQTSLRKAKFSLKTATLKSGINDSTSYILGWIDEMEKALEARDDLKSDESQEFTKPVVEDVLRELDSYIGLEKVKQRVREICNLVIFNKLRQDQGLKVEQPSLHMVFTGNPGTGKTSIARIIAKVFKALGVLKKGHLVEVGRADLVGEYVGHTAVKTLGKLKEAREGVLFIDEAYSLVRGQGNDFGIEAIDTIVKEMEDKRKELVIILAGYPNEMDRFLQSNPGLQSRFNSHILFEDYSIDELLEIGKIMLQQKQYQMTDEAAQVFRKILVQKVSENPKSHGNGRLVRNIIEEAILCKANYVVTCKQRNLPYGQLDEIEKIIMNMVLLNMTTLSDAENLVKGKYQMDPKGLIN
ncbi:AAA family ATPase [Bacillus sp. AK128]